MDSGDGNRGTVRLVNLGCAKNVVDSEEMLGVLSRAGCRIDAHARDADVLIVNTCAFIEAARQESVDAILEALEEKRRGRVRRVVVAGCLAQRHGAELARELAEVDAFVGTGQTGSTGAVVRDALTRPGQVLRIPEKPHHRWLDVPTRVRSTAPWTAWLKISEGCDHQCTFCAIPSFRGAHVSKPLERVLEEARMLADQGVREVCLIAQDSTQYGYDLCGEPLLPRLLADLSAISSLRWLRVFYCYPSRVNDRLIRAIAETPKVCQYLDMPLQHADPGILRAMRRPGDGASYLRLIERIREASPDVALRTTFIVGFPGETEEQFAALERFVEAARFDRVGVFEYSVEEGTPSASLPGRVPARIKRQRRDRLMRLQQAISLERGRRWIGRTMEVLVEQSRVHGVTGRTFRDGPDVDGQVHVAGSRARPGDFIQARITGAQPYDLEGTAAAVAESLNGCRAGGRPSLSEADLGPCSPADSR